MQSGFIEFHHAEARGGAQPYQTGLARTRTALPWSRDILIFSKNHFLHVRFFKKKMLGDGWIVGHCSCCPRTPALRAAAASCARSRLLACTLLSALLQRPSEGRLVEKFLLDISLKPN